MDITVTIPDQFFLTSKTPEQIVEELRQAAMIFWRARGDISTEAANEIKARAPNEDIVEGETMMDVLLQMPDVGDDSIFERPVEYEREQPEWHT
ncbi:MAG: hypothetical protein ABI193_09170 [Minicystis sp.]